MHTLHLITSTRSFFEQQIEVLKTRGVNCTIIRAPGEYTADSPRTMRDYLRYYPRVLEALRREDFDLVHAHYGLVAPFAIAQPTRPVVLSLWGTDLMSEMAWLRGLSHFGARFADATVLPSHVMADALGREYEYIPFGVDTEQFRPIPKDVARERVGWEHEDTIALFPYDPARPVKNYALAEQAIEAASVDIAIRTLQHVPHHEMPYYMNASDVMLVTSHRESGPMTVKEASACNLPIVSRDVGFVRDTIDEVRNCAICETPDEFGREIDRIVTDGGPSNGRQVIDDLDLDAMGDRLVSLYDRLLDRPEMSAPALDVDGDRHGA